MNTKQGLPQVWLATGHLFRLVLMIALVAGTFATQKVWVHAAPNGLPIAVPDDRLDQPLTIPTVVDVLANDIDDDNDLDPASVRIIDPADLINLSTTLVVAGEGIWQVNTDNGNITFSRCTAAGEPDPSCGDTFTDAPFPVEYSVSDGSGQRSNPAIVTITYDPDVTASPVALDDEATTTMGQLLSVDVLKNDTDPDGQIDINSVTISAAPSHGNAQPGSGGTIEYTPTGEYTGPDQVGYSVCDTDPTPRCATATLFITVIPPAVNQPPLIVNDDPPAIAYAVATPIEVLANDSDPDGTLVGASVSVVTPPNHGTAIPTGDGSGRITYTPASNYSGSDQFTYRACDDGSPSKCGEAIVRLTILPPPNQPPTANDDQATTQQNRAVIIPILSNDRDPENSLDLTSVTVADEPTNGSVTINPTNGQATYTPALDFIGTDLFTYTVCDLGSPSLCSISATVQITIARPPNQPPVVSDDNATTQQNGAVTVNVLINDFDPDGVLNVASCRSRVARPADRPSSTETARSPTHHPLPS